MADRKKGREKGLSGSSEWDGERNGVATYELTRETNIFLLIASCCAGRFSFSCFCRKISARVGASYYDSVFMYCDDFQPSFALAFATFPT